MTAAIILAARYEEKFKASGSALQRSAAIYQLLLVQFLDKPVERSVYRRCMDVDFERDLDEKNTSSPCRAILRYRMRR